MTRAMLVTAAVNLRSWPDLPTKDQPDNIVRTLSAGQNVSADELERVTTDGKTWLYVVGKDSTGKWFNGWVAAEYLKSA